MSDDQATTPDPCGGPAHPRDHDWLPTPAQPPPNTDQHDAGNARDRRHSRRFTVRIHTSNPDAMTVVRPLLRAWTTLLGSDTLTVIFNESGHRVATFSAGTG